MSLVVPVVDEVVAGVPIPTGGARDANAAPPIQRAPRTLYGWAVDDTYALTGTGDGSLDESTVRVRLEYCHAPGAEATTGEEAQRDRERAVSVALDDAAGAVVAWFRGGHRKGTTYEAALVERVTLDTVRTLNFRGFAVDLRLTRLLV